MAKITWIISSIAIITFVVSIISTIVTKTESTPSWKKVGKVLIWIIGLLVFKVVFWGIVSIYQQEKPPSSTANEQTKIRTWIFHYSMRPGEKTDDGYTESTFVTDITKDDGSLLWADLYDANGVVVGNLRLARNERKLVGRINNNQEGSSGEIYLTPEDGNWVGSMIYTNHSPIACTLKRK